MSNLPTGMTPCDEVLLCVDDAICESCPQSHPLIPSEQIPPLVKGRHYRAKAAVPEDDEGHPPGWWIPDLDPMPLLIHCGCGEHIALVYPLRCARHFGKIDDEQIPDVLERIRSAGHTTTPVRETEDA